MPPSSPGAPSELADELLARQPVVIDYGSGSVWTSTLAPASAQSDGRTPEVAHPCIYSCPSVELPGLVKFGIHGGAVSTAATRWVVGSVIRIPAPP